MNKQGSIKLVRKLFYSLDKKRKYQFFTLVLMNVISSCMEGIAISITYPFLSLLQSPDAIVNETKIINIIFGIFGVGFEFRSIVIFFMISILFSSFLKFAVIAFNAIFANLVAYDFSLASFQSSLKQDYSFFLENPISNLINRNTKGIDGTLIIISSFLQIITSCLLILITISFLIFLSPKTTIGIFIIISSIYLLIFLSFNNFISKASKIIYNNNSYKFKIIQEGYRYFKNIIIDKTAYIFFKYYKKNEYQLRRLEAIQQIITQCPKIIIENSILILLGISSLLVNRGNSIDFTFLALLGTYALSFQRLLPIAQSMYKGFNYVKRYSADLKDVLELSIKKDDFYSSKQPFTKQIDIEEIVVKDINFSYKRNGKNLFNKINFKLIPGDFLGIMGKSGSGKSTLIDILLGLLIPSNGHVFINEIDINLSESKEYLERWQNSISYVPQSPLILNDTIKKNLQINGSKNQNISEKDIYDVLEVVQLKHFVSSLPFKFETILGDDGNTISGGQKQRLAIARALLKRGKVLILDESTSGLDIETEQKLIEAIVSKFPKLIIIFVSHKKSAFKLANFLINLDNQI